MPRQSAKYCVGLSMLPGIGPARFARLIERCGSAERAWSASLVDLKACGVDDRALPEVLKARQAIDVDAELERVRHWGARVLTYDDPAYPTALAETFGRPPVLYVLGTITPEDSQAIAVVGTRRPSLYGQAEVAKLVPLLVRHRLTIVSGWRLE